MNAILPLAVFRLARRSREQQRRQHAGGFGGGVCRQVRGWNGGGGVGGARGRAEAVLLAVQGGGPRPFVVVVGTPTYQGWFAPLRKTGEPS